MNGVCGVVPVKLKVEVKRRVALEDEFCLVSVMFGGKVALALGVTLKAPLETASHVKYWTVVPLIQLRTSVTDDAE
jgi:hypothetical protein